MDETPSFWNVVCGVLPMEVNAASMAKSGQSPLIVHCPFTIPDLVVEFMELVNSQRSRWVAASFELDASDLDSVTSYLADPAPQLQTLGIKGDQLARYPEAGINLLGGQTQNIRKLGLSFTPIQWSPDSFIGLKSLQLHQEKPPNDIASRPDS